MRIAFTSSTGERIDEHFGRAEHFHVWEVGPETRFVERVSAITTAEDEEDRIAARASALAGCTRSSTPPRSAVRRRRSSSVAGSTR